MPEGIAVEITNGFATIAPSSEKRQDVLNALLKSTPVELIEKLTRSGPTVQYRVPEGNAREAGLVDGASGPVLDRKDLGFADALVEADPNAYGESHWHQHQITSKGSVYVAGRDGANGAIQGPLRPNKPVGTPPPPPEGATRPTVSLQEYVKENTPNPADYAPDKSVPVALRSPSGQATIASVQSGAVSVDPEGSVELVTVDGTPTYDDGKPDADWSRAALNSYAVKLGIGDAKGMPNKTAVLDAIRAVEA